MRKKMRTLFEYFSFSINYERHLALIIVILSAFIVPQYSAATIQLSKEQDMFNNVTCETTNDCSNYNGSVCNYTVGLCECPLDKPIFVNTTLQGYCLESFNLSGGNCTFNQQCNYNHGECKDKICICSQEYEKDEGACIRKKNIIIPIAVACVIGISLISTICVYCWMSRKDKRKV